MKKLCFPPPPNITLQVPTFIYIHKSILQEMNIKLVNENTVSIAR